MKIIFAAVVLALVGTISLASCTGETSKPASSARALAAGDASREPALGPVSVLANADQIALPLDYYRATTQQRVALRTAYVMILHDCLARFGFIHKIPVVKISPDYGRRYGITNETEAANYGYNPPPEVDGGKEAESATSTKQSSAESTVLNGVGVKSVNGKEVPQGGCYGEAYGKFGLKRGSSSLTEAGILVEDLNAQAVQSTRADTRIAAVWAKWSACMKEAGYSYRTPWDANNDPSFDGSSATARERATATKDVECKKKYNVAGISFAVETAYQKAYIEKNAEELAAEKKKLDDRIRLASAIVTAGNGAN